MNTTLSETKMKLSPEQSQEILARLKARFGKFMNRHQRLEWADVQARLEDDPGKLWSLYEMEKTGGEPDVVGKDKKTGEYIFIDCSPETPAGRRNTCYDRAGQDERERKGVHPPGGNAIDMAASMGIEILNEEQYRELQELGTFDTKTSSWLKTPPEVRKLGGAFFADYRYGKVFLYHNSAPSFYSARGFRGLLRV